MDNYVSVSVKENFLEGAVCVVGAMTPDSRNGGRGFVKYLGFRDL